MRNFFTLLVLCFLVSSVFPKISNACSVGDTCRRYVCDSGKDYFGTYTREAINFNYNYYDLIFIGVPTWEPEDIKSYQITHGIPYNWPSLAPLSYKVLEVFKNTGSIQKNDKGEFLLEAHPRKVEFQIKSWSEDEGIIERKICADGHKNSYKSKQDNRVLIYAKMHQKIKHPVIIRALSISENSYNSTKAKEADLVFSAVLNKTKRMKRKSSSMPKRTPDGLDWSQYYIDEYVDVDVIKGDEFMGRKKLILKTSRYRHPAIRVDYKPKQKLLFYARESTYLKGYYDIFHMSEDVGPELELFRKK